MKKSLTLTVVFSACFVLISLAQGPMLSLVGGSPSFAKGNINTEILSKVIQQKQEEVKQYVFRNTIIKEFNNSQYTDHLKNYTTYSFLYNLMDVMTSGGSTYKQGKKGYNIISVVCNVRSTCCC